MFATKIEFKPGGLSVVFDDGTTAEAAYKYVNNRLEVVGLNPSQEQALRYFIVNQIDSSIWTGDPRFASSTSVIGLSAVVDDTSPQLGGTLTLDNLRIYDDNGIARGAGAIDLQLGRSANGQVASGLGSFNCGYGNTADGDYSFAANSGNIALGYASTVFGQSGIARFSGETLSNQGLAGNGSAQVSTVVIRGQLSGPGSVTLTANAGELTVQSNQMCACAVSIVGIEDAGRAISFRRNCLFQNADGITTLLASDVVGTDVNPSNDYSLVISDGTSDEFHITVVSSASSYTRFAARLEIIDLGFPTEGAVPGTDWTGAPDTLLVRFGPSDTNLESYEVAGYSWCYDTTDYFTVGDFGWVDRVTGSIPVQWTAGFINAGTSTTSYLNNSISSIGLIGAIDRRYLEDGDWEYTASEVNAERLKLSTSLIGISEAFVTSYVAGSLPGADNFVWLRSKFRARVQPGWYDLSLYLDLLRCAYVEVSINNKVVAIGNGLALPDGCRIDSTLYTDELYDIDILSITGKVSDNIDFGRMAAGLSALEIVQASPPLPRYLLVDVAAFGSTQSVQHEVCGETVVSPHNNSSLNAQYRCELIYYGIWNGYRRARWVSDFTAISNDHIYQYSVERVEVNWDERTGRLYVAVLAYPVPGPTGLSSSSCDIESIQYHGASKFGSPKAENGVQLGLWSGAFDLDYVWHNILVPIDSAWEIARWATGPINFDTSHILVRPSNAGS